MSGNQRTKQFVNVTVPLPAEMRDKLYARSLSDGKAARPSITEGAELSIRTLLSANRPFNLQRPPRQAERTNLSIEKTLAVRIKDLASKLDMNVSEVIYSMLLEESGPPPRTVYFDGFQTAHAA
jgi:hypothetical protein